MAESKVRDDNFFLVSGWMLNRLNLKGVALQVFSIIYGFSQDGETYFTGSLQYLMDFTNASKPTIIKTLKELVEKGYLLKYENEMNGVKFNKYKANLLLVKELNRGCQDFLPGGSQNFLPPPSKETLPNNILLDNKDYISKDIVNEVISLYHSICVSFPTIRALTDTRKKAVQTLLKTYTLDDFRTVFTNAEESSFLKGMDGDWKASFDWMMKESKFLKILEGNYVDKSKKRRKEPVPGWMEHSLGEAELEAIRRTLAEPIPGFDAPDTAGNNPDIAERAEQLKKELQGWKP